MTFNSNRSFGRHACTQAMAAVAAVGLLVTGCAASGEADPAATSDGATQVKLFLSKGQSSWPFHVASEKGFFDDQGLDVEITSFESGGDAATSFVAQGADVMQAGDLPTVLFMADAEASIVGDTDHHRGVILVAGKEVSGPADISKIAANLNGSEGYWVDKYVKDGGIDDSAEVINLAPDAGASALISGQVTAVLSTSSRLGPLLASNDDFRILERWPSANFLIISDKFKQEHPDAATGLLRALDGAWQFIQEETPEAAQIQGTAEGLPPNVPEEWLAADYELSYAAQFGQMEYDLLAEMSAWAFESGKIKKQFDVCDIVDLAPLEKAVPGGVTDSPCSEK